MYKALKNKWRVIGIALILFVLLGIFLIYPRKSGSNPSIGIYYYPWYIGDWGINHENCSDAPYLGDYNSANLSVIVQHLNWLRKLGVDFIIFSWWGKDSPSDSNTKLVLNQIEKNYSDIQFFIMVESFDTDWLEAYDNSSKTYNFNLIYDYIHNNYISKFSLNIFSLDGKPVIGFYDGPDRIFTKNTVPSDDRFSIRLIGCNPEDDWEYEVPNPYLSNQPVCRDGEISVCPRYDSNETEWHEDVDYTEGLYDAQWSRAMSEVKQGNVKIITIISWNEFSERTQIEPTFDVTSAFKEDPFYLFDKTQTYIENVKAVENEVNVCLHLSDYGCSTISHLTELGVRCVRTDWLITNDTSMRDYSQNLQDNNINLLATVNMSNFDQIELKEWNKTVLDIVNSEGFANTDAVEICNEPNSNVSYVEPEIYYEMLKSAYVIIKNYTRIPVVFAGISPNFDNWQDYLNRVFAYGDIQDYFDIMGIHLYDDMQKNLDTLKFVKSLTSKPIWLTETGKPSATENYNETVQAEYLSSVCSTLKPLINKIFIYELKDNSGPPDDKESNFGLLTVDGIQKEAYWIVCDFNR